MAGVLYGGLSALCLLSTSSPFLETLVRRHWGLVWVMGPTAALFYGFDYVLTYIIGSAVVASCIGGAVHGYRRESPALLVCAVLAVFAWIAFGLLAYAPTM